MRFKKIRLPDGNVIADTGLPQMQTKPIYLELHVRQRATLIEALRTEGCMENGMVYYICLDMIYSMLDMGRRAAALEELDKLTAERLKEAGEDSLDYGARMLIKSETAHEITQLFTDYMDLTFGVSHHIAIGLSGSAPDDDKLEYDTPKFDDDETMDGKWVDEEEVRK